MLQRSILTITMLALGALSCNLSAIADPAPGAADLAGTQAAIALTQTALAQPTEPAAAETPAPAPTAAAARGSIRGTLGFPSEMIPPLLVFAIAADGSRHYSVSTGENQAEFVIEGVEPGVYYVVAYVEGAPSLAGAWTEFVPCGLSVDCDDHSLIPVTVAAGQTAEGVEVKDWYAPPDAFPPMPGP